LSALKSTLAAAGQYVLEDRRMPTIIRDLPERMELDPVALACAKAFMETTQRVTYPDGGYSQLWTWRGKPLYMVKP
jgi:hypothetical protein